MLYAALRFGLDLPVRWPRSVVLGVLALSVFFAAQIVDFRTGQLQLRIDPSVEGLLPKETRDRDYLDHLETTFGEREPVIVALGMGDVFERAHLEILEEVSDQLSRLPGVREVVSLATTDTVRSEAGETLIDPFVSRIRDGPRALAELRKEILSNRIYAGNLVSKDGGTAAILLYLESGGEGRDDVHRRIVDTARGSAPGVDVFVTGSPYVKAVTAELLLKNFTWVLPLALLAIIGVALLAFRSVAGVVVSCSAVLIGVIWVLGGLVLIGRPLNLVTIIVPPLLLSVGFAYAVHVVSDYYAEIGKSGGSVAAAEAVRRALGDVALPIALTGLTTAAGFLSLTVSPFAAVQEFGFIAVVGVGVVVLLALSYAPALLAILPAPRPAREVSSRRDRFDAFAAWLADFALAHRDLVLVLGGAVFVLSLVGMTQIRVNTRIIDNLPADHPVRTDFFAISERLGGASTFNVVIEADAPDSFVDPRILAQVDEFELWLEAQPEIGSCTSLLDHLKLIHRVFRDDDPAFETIPERAALSKQLLLLGGSRDMVNYVDAGYRNLNIHVRTSAVDSESLRQLMDRVEERLANLPPELRPRVTGSTVLLSGAADAVAGGQLKSLSLAFAFIFVILAVLFTSLRVGAAALIPNALPVAAYFGLVGVLGVALDTSTGLLACIVLGIAVDDTIHLLTRFNREAHERANEIEGARHAILGVARPVSITTLALCAGLLVLTSSELQNQVRFGALGAVTLAFAWLVDLTFTPALCSRLKIVSLWDVLTYDLGAAPQKTIPLFAGLSNLQARVVALVTRVVEIPAGTRVCTEGERGEHLWIVIDGELEVSLDSGGRRTVLEHLTRGAVVGEIALFYDHRRSADVDALTDVRAVRLSKENLQRFRSRHPRLAARVLWNLSEILAERLVLATQRYRSEISTN